MFIGARLFEDVALYTKKKGITTVLTESNPDAPNISLSDYYYPVSRGIEGPKKIAIKEDVDAIVPLIGVDGPLTQIAELKKDLEESYDIPVVASPYYAASICQDKIKTKKFLEKNHFRTPASQLINHKSNLPKDFPIVLKQPHGQGGSGVKIVKNLKEAEEYFKMFKSALAEEFVDGTEISVEVLGWEGKYFPLVPVYKGKTTLEGTHPLDKLKKVPLNLEGIDNESNNQFIRELVTKIASIIGIEGCADFDLIFNGKENLILEINTRPTGTRYLTTASSDINPMHQLVDMALGEWNPSSLEKKIKKYFALEVPVGDYSSQYNNYKFREFPENNCWIIHGPPLFQRITIRGNTMEDVLNTADKLNIDLNNIT